MIPVYSQNNDDCFTACIASITGIPYKEIPIKPPKFTYTLNLLTKERIIGDDEGHLKWWEEWLYSKGWKVNLFSKPIEEECIICLVPLSYPYQLRSIEVFAISHAVISRNHKTIHDPTPSHQLPYEYKSKTRYKMFWMTFEFFEIKC